MEGGLILSYAHQYSPRPVIFSLSHTYFVPMSSSKWWKERKGTGSRLLFLAWWYRAGIEYLGQLWTEEPDHPHLSQCCHCTGYVRCEALTVIGRLLSRPIPGYWVRYLVGTRVSHFRLYFFSLRSETKRNRNPFASFSLRFAKQKQ